MKQISYFTADGSCNTKVLHTPNIATTRKTDLHKTNIGRSNSLTTKAFSDYYRLCVSIAANNELQLWMKFDPSDNGEEFLSC